ncbi:MAG: CCA tRNA nucleotidyltransferase [Candidatus Heimdallarchaeaceae archaeon]
MRGSDPNLRYFVAELHRNNINYQIYQISPKELSRIAPTVQNKINETKRIASELNCLIGIVGGFVRDLLLGNPSHDVDFIVFSGDLQQLTEKVAEVLQGKIAKMFNKTFTTQIRFENGVILEFNATRKEYYEYPSRMPIVEKGSIVDDLYRRDFTINAFVLFGDKYVDVFSGTKDLKDLVIRTTREPSIVFKEDYLRMFRAIRFACTLDFHISSEVKGGIRKNAKNILVVPKERILTELKMAIKAKPLKCYNLMRELKIFEILFSNVPNNTLNTEEYKCNNTWDKIALKLQYLQQEKVEDEIVLLAAIFSEIPFDGDFQKNTDIREISEIKKFKSYLADFRFSNKEIRRLVIYIKSVKELFHFVDFSPSKLALRMYLRKVYPYLEDVILLAKAEEATRHQKSLDEIISKLRKLNEQPEFFLIDLAINGHDLQELFGFKGREIGDIKNELVTAIMNEKIKNTREELISYIQSHKFYS